MGFAMAVVIFLVWRIRVSVVMSIVLLMGLSMGLSLVLSLDISRGVAMCFEVVSNARNVWRSLYIPRKFD